MNNVFLFRNTSITNWQIDQESCDKNPTANSLEQ